MIDLICHKVIVYNQTESQYRTCQCKDDCGGGILIKIVNESKETSDIKLYFYMQWALSFANVSDNYPLWMINLIEDGMVFDGKCRCKIFQTWSDNLYVFILYITLAIAQIFYPKLYHLVDNTNKNYVNSFFCVLFPFLFIISMFNILIASRLIKKDSSAFIVQFFEAIAACLSMFFNSSIHIYILLGSTNFAVLNKIFALWNHLLAFTLVCDRYLCFSKPVFYKISINRKKSTVFCFVLLIVSSIFQSVAVFISVFESSFKQLLMIAIFYTFECFLLFSIILATLVLLMKFYLLLKKVASETTSQLNGKEKNINRIVISTALIEIMPGAVCAITSLISVFIYAFAYNGVDAGFYTKLLFDVLAVYQILITLAPLISIVLCSVFSKLYRECLMSLFCCCCKRFTDFNSVAPSSSRM